MLLIKSRTTIGNEARRVKAPIASSGPAISSSSLSLADIVRHSGVPEHFWGKWAPSADLCRDDKSTVVVSGKGYLTAQESCEVQWVAETAGRNGPIYSAHMRCSILTVPEQTRALNQEEAATTI